MSAGRDDGDLVDRCIAGDPRAWRSFVDRFAPTVKALARRTLALHGRPASDADVEDVVQEVMVALHADDRLLLRRYDRTHSLKTYLGVLTRTHAHRALRKRRPFPAAETPDAASDPAAVVDEAARREERDALEAALGTLPPRDAELLRLRFFRELDYRAISETLAIPESSVGQLLHRAKKRLLDAVYGARPK